jgi:hypothetical protein
VKQRRQLRNAIRGHLAEYGWVAPAGATHLAMLVDLLEGGEIGGTLHETARPMFAKMVEMLAGSTRGSPRWKRKSRVVPATREP